MLELDDFWSDLLQPATSVEVDDGAAPKPGDIWERNDQGDSVRIVRVRGESLMCVPVDGGRLLTFEVSDFVRRYRVQPKRRDALATHVDPDGRPIAHTKWRDAINPSSTTIFVVASVDSEGNVEVQREMMFPKPMQFRHEEFFRRFIPFRASAPKLIPQRGDRWRSLMFANDVVEIDRLDVTRSEGGDITEIVHENESDQLGIEGARTWHLTEFLSRFVRIHPPVPAPATTEKSVDALLSAAWKHMNDEDAAKDAARIPVSFLDDPFNTRDVILPGQVWQWLGDGNIHEIMLGPIDLIEGTVDVVDLSRSEKPVSSLSLERLRSDFKFVRQPAVPWISTTWRHRRTGLIGTVVNLIGGNVQPTSDEPFTKVVLRVDRDGHYENYAGRFYVDFEPADQNVAT